MQRRSGELDLKLLIFQLASNGCHIFSKFAWRLVPNLHRLRIMIQARHLDTNSMSPNCIDKRVCGQNLLSPLDQLHLKLMSDARDVGGGSISSMVQSL